MAKSSDNSAPYWNWLPLSDSAVALYVFTEPPQQRTPPEQSPAEKPAEPRSSEPIPAVQLAAASSATTQVLVGLDQLAEFVLVHRDLKLICYDAAKLHWVLWKHFAGNAEARALLWQFAADGRLIDVMLLNQLGRLAIDDFPKSKKLEELAQQ